MNRTVGQTRPIVLLFNETGVVNKKYYLPQSPRILAAITKGIVVVTADQLSATYSFTGLASAPISPTQLKNFTLTLCDIKGDEIFKDLVPFSFTVGNNNGGLRQFFNHHIDTSKSYVKFQDATGITANQTFLMIQFLTN